MSTTNTITITPLDEQPLLFTQEEETLIEGVRTELAGWSVFSGSGEISRSEREVEVAGESKYEADFVDPLTTLSKGRVIVWNESWDDEDGGGRTRTFTDGELKATEDRVMVMLSAEYRELTKAVREALAGGAADTSSWPELFRAATALVDLIDPVAE